MEFEEMEQLDSWDCEITTFTYCDIALAMSRSDDYTDEQIRELFADEERLSRIVDTFNDRIQSCWDGIMIDAVEEVL